jgi:hypothetical protein
MIGFKRPARTAPIHLSGANGGTDVEWPWCDACKSYHHPQNTTCKKLKEQS